MRNDNQQNETPNKPQQQTGEEFGKVKGRQLTGENTPERWDTSAGTLPPGRGTAGPRG
jgi:hypothetical protein